ncbi:caspase family protein [Leptothoe sp. PORK10 BA2]|uniref:caspase family protein n=1 Tax=Leptothoe sp. PORK10 BA2 TaxID=3110254 RepID=UPI002B2191B9|nr:caspase family protein [Leptothoe sp. PORK10 BA2]MEA5462211.1 caspase family protein [Leptothoe sp. PORK10 BA2]
MSRDALIVGINQYQNLPRLNAAAKDAEGMANMLEIYGDFRVRRLPEIIENQRPKIGQQTPVSTQQLENSLVRLLLPKGDHIPETVFFYFSGHGLQREVGLREGYLATSDTQPNTSNSGVSLSWLRRLIKHSPVRQILIILDCCHSGEFLSLKDEAWQGSDGQSYLFIAASREYEEAYESLSSDYSVLTQAVLSSLLPQQAESGRVTSTDLVAAITNQLSHEIQQPLFEQGGSEIVITRQSERPLPQLDNISLISRLKQYSFNFCPYLGPHPFEEKHAEYYFGRETLTQELLQTLQQTNICALIGASGNGKTSLLRAGLIPRLAAGNDILGSENWLVRYVPLGPQPLKNLAAAFTLGKQEIEVAHQLLQAENLLRQGSDGLANLVTAALIQQPNAKKMWLVIDQFEDLLTPTTDPQLHQERAALINALVTALRGPAHNLGIIIGLRSDAMGNLLTHGELFSLIEKNRVVMTPMSYQEIRDVIEKPAEKLGLTIDPYLIHNLTLDLTGAPGELALLQSTLHELWQHRSPVPYGKGGPCLSLDSYMKLGRISTMLTDRATALYESLPQDEQNVVQRIFLSLCDLGEGRFDQERQVRKFELINQRFSQSLIDQILQKLVKAGLVVVDQPQLPPQTDNQLMVGTVWETQGQAKADVQRWLVAQSPTSATKSTVKSEETITLAHKSLVSDWHLLRQWLQTSRTILRQRRDLETRAWIWYQRGELTCSEYLLGQQYMKDAEQFLETHLEDLSTLAQRFVQVSQRISTYRRWQTRGVAVLLPLAVMAGMTVSLVRHQLAASWRIRKTPSTTAQLSPPPMGPTSGNAISPLLPQQWGRTGVERLAITSQILDFNRNYP